ncbi:MAG: hypothetical protein K2K97_09525 [Muribaculaceae bacterium]|nr:hypothetical protein [Muribaculaceae bacterium]
MGQEPKKFHVSDDGKIFRINEDGSFTELGNANDLNTPEEEMNKNQHNINQTSSTETPPPYQPEGPNNHNKNGKKTTLIVALSIIALAFVIECIVLFTDSSHYYNIPDDVGIDTDVYIEEVSEYIDSNDIPYSSTTNAYSSEYPYNNYAAYDSDAYTPEYPYYNYDVKDSEAYAEEDSVYFIDY